MPIIVLDSKTRESLHIAVSLALGYQWATVHRVAVVSVAVLLEPADLAHRLFHSSEDWTEGRAEGAVIDLDRQHTDHAPALLDYTMYGAGTEALTDWLEKNRCTVKVTYEPEEGNWRIMVSHQGTGTGISPSFPLALCAAICGACGITLPECPVYAQYVDLEGIIAAAPLWTPDQQRLAAHLREHYPPPLLTAAQIVQIVEAQPQGTPEAFEAQVQAARSRPGVNSPVAFVIHLWRVGQQLPLPPEAA